MNIFEDGYLKKHFINPNYNGLVGWDCEQCISISFEDPIRATWEDAKLMMSHNGNVHCFNGKGDDLGGIPMRYRVKQFKPEGIPVGELCWVSKDGIQWTQQRFHAGADMVLYTVNYDIVGSSQKIFEQWIYCVPYLIAETAEDAERLKDWYK